MKKHFALISFALAAACGSLTAAENPAFQVSVSGHGKPMILIPGLACPGEVWDTTVAHFKDRYECHVLSLAGFAGTPAKTGEVIEPAREAIAAYIRDHKLDHPIIVGHSLGGFLALHLGSKNADLVGPMVVVDGAPFLMGLMQPGATLEQAKASAKRARQYFDSLDDASYQQSIRSGTGTRPMVTSDEDHARVVAWSLASDRATVTNAMTEMYSADLRDDLARIKAPTLVLPTWIGYKPYADHDQIEAAFGTQFAKLSGAKITVSDTAHHFIMFDDPKWLFAQIESFLASIPAESSK